MIRYALACDREHEFEGWFGSSADFDDQQARGLVSCPVCASKAVRKQIMAPAVAGTKRKGQPDAPAPTQAMMMEAMGRLRRHVEETFDDVGDAFATEARAIHEGRSGPTRHNVAQPKCFAPPSAGAGGRNAGKNHPALPAQQRWR